jgi:hypothetical protein
MNEGPMDFLANSRDEQQFLSCKTGWERKTPGRRLYGVLLMAQTHSQSYTDTQFADLFFLNLPMTRSAS